MIDESVTDTNKSINPEYTSVADPAIGEGGGLPPRLVPKMWRPQDGHFKLYMNHCHRYPVNIFVINICL